MRRSMLLGIVAIVVALAAVLAMVLIQLQGSDNDYIISITEVDVTEDQAVQIASNFFESNNRTIGQVLLTDIQEKTPNNYWQELYALESHGNQGSRTCWVVRFEQALLPGHWVEVWVDGDTGDVVGGAQCR